MKVLLDIQDGKALHLLEVLKDLPYVKMQQLTEPKTSALKYKGAMSKQPIEDIDKQLKDLRNIKDVDLVNPFDSL